MKILIIEDEYSLADAIAETLRTEKFQANIITNGEEGEKIFERFYRIDKSRNRKEKRYGLGLAIAKSTIEKYRGKIEVFYKDNYTDFKVTIPN